MTVRHPVLLSLWALIFALAGLGLAKPLCFVAVFLVSPMLALATFGHVFDRGSPPLASGWRFMYRACTGALTLVTSVALFVAGTYGDHPLAILFLVILVTCWPALTRPTPRRAALPAVVALWGWIPLVLTSVVHRNTAPPWSQQALTGSVIAVLCLAAICAVLSLVSFGEEPRLAPATARM